MIGAEARWQANVEHVLDRGDAMPHGHLDRGRERHVAPEILDEPQRLGRHMQEVDEFVAAPQQPGLLERVHGEFVITLRLASGTDRGNGTAKRSDQGRHGRAAVRQIFLLECCH